MLHISRVPSASRAPLLSRPGAMWNRELMTLGDIARMVGSWPIRFFKNHATASLHKPNSGFLADHRWERGQDVPVDVLDIAMREERQRAHVASAGRMPKVVCSAARIRRAVAANCLHARFARRSDAARWHSVARSARPARTRAHSAHRRAARRLAVSKSCSCR